MEIGLKTMNKIKAAIIGATGYVGEEIFRILLNHPNIEITHLTTMSYIGKKYSEIYPQYSQITELECIEENIEEISKECDVMFLALPHGICANKLNEKILKNCKVIDMSADFRIKNKDIYEKWYKVKHNNQELLNQAVYGLVEIHREKIKKSCLIANPGCYTTCSILSLYPIVKENLIDTNSIIIDAKSGISGAGRKADLNISYCECAESIKAYSVASHRHTPEIEQELSMAINHDIKLTFIPHLIPMNRGILTTCYMKLNQDIDYENVLDVYKKYYSSEKFIRILKENTYPETKNVKASQYLDLGFKIDKRTNTLIVLGAIDNLVKGAAGQAVVNMNLMFDLKEDTGLNPSGIFPV